MNPNKCAFGVSAGQFLGFMVHQRGIEISRRSIDAINKIVAPTNKTELQSLIGKVNFIRRFISNLSGRIRAFSPLLKLKADQEFADGDLVWKLILPVGTKSSKFGKWSPNWEGPYRIRHSAPGNAYILETLEGVEFPRALNGKYLKKYYPSIWIDA